MTPEEAIRRLRHNTDATAHAPEALQFVIDAVQELSALKAMRALSSRPPTLESAHEVIAMMDVEVTGSMADVVGLRQQIRRAQAAFIVVHEAWRHGYAEDLTVGLVALGEALGVEQ
jgi:hypothetical protein